MLEVPLSLDPTHVLGLKVIGTTAICSGCKMEFDLEHGIVYQTQFHLQDAPEDLKYAYIPFCDTLCLLENWQMRGSA